MLISIIVPVYKAEEYLEKCVDSILSQTHQDLEVILVDDGSPDTCAEMCDLLAASDNRIVVIHKNNGGVSSARNVGLAASKGEYVGFVDSDDWIEESMYYVLLKNALETKSDISICGYNIIQEPGKVASFTLQSKSRIILNREKAIKDVLYAHEYVKGNNVWTKLFKRSLLEGKAFDQTIHISEDHLFLVHALLDSNQIVVDPKLLYNYNFTNVSAIRSSFSEEKLTELKACEAIEDLLYERYPYLCPYIHAFGMHEGIRLLMLIESSKINGREQYIRIMQNYIRQRLSWKSIRIINTNNSRVEIILAAINIQLFFGKKRFRRVIGRLYSSICNRTTRGDE